MKITPEQIKEKYSNYNGIDTSVSESLFVYGLIWRQSKDNFYHFVYGIKKDIQGYYCEFENAYFPDNTNIESDFDGLIDNEDFYSYTGTNKQDWLKLKIGQQVFDLFNYYGHLDVFGY